ncbi:DUF429 domain-containing protein [Salisediminibacterium halotolerans]|uniref:DUF429 domain-containing protein n=1 Tax=Salisediminibacterium halotolerans TaxID=517425 RepID=A0A1H9VIK4_9BACI|nr:DUF429 domain-containing protein [Salisediminibacterium haloalkalitolerans]SES21354.1 Protein of unknown function [Salisediminibacterium haloalkalitolerans]
MDFNRVIGIGWDVSGWMGNNHGAAICEWKRETNRISWLGSPAEVAIPENNLLSLKHFIQQVDPSFNLSSLDEHTLVVIGVDAPLGFPAAFTELLIGGRPEMVKPKREIDNPLAYRYTDREIHRVFGKKPLSAAYDRIGNNATAAMLHTKRWQEEEYFQIYPFTDPNSADRRVIIEVYPALLKEKKFKEVHEHLAEFFPSNVAPGTDAYDACICALYAISFSTNGLLLPKLQGPPEDHEEEVKEEGWIYYFANETSK